MANTLLTWFQNFCAGLSEAGAWLISTPFKDSGIDAIKDLTPLMLISLTGLIIFIGVAIVKWVIS